MTMTISEALEVIGDVLSGVSYPYGEAWDVIRSRLEVSDEPDVALLVSMAMRINHGFGVDDQRSQEIQLADMRRCWEEVVGKGFYRPENRKQYLAALVAALGE